MVRGEIDRDERPETGLHVRQEEGEDIEPVIGVEVAKPPLFNRVAHMAMERSCGCQRRGDDLVQDISLNDRGSSSRCRRA